MPADKTEIRTILAKLSAGAILLPGSTVAEVIAYSEPRPYNDVPEWLLGEVGWSDWGVPVISFAILSGKSTKEENSANNRILVVKSLSGSSRAPYLGILINGVPRMVKVTPGSLTKPQRLPECPSVFREITLGEDQVLIPDLDELSRTVQEALGDQ